MNKPAHEGGSPVRKTFLTFAPPDIREEEILSVASVLRSKWITRGKKCEEFEKAISAYTGSRHAVVLNSATAGLFLSLKVAGTKEGDEVITTPYTFAASANVIIHTGAKPVFADIEEDTFSISPAEIEKKITKNTRAIMPVHFAGHPVEIDTIDEIAKSNDLIVVEDAAHAIGTEYKGKKIGNGDRISVFSFHAVKNLTTAEGGAVTTNDTEFAGKLKLYSLHGQTRDAYSKLLVGGWKYDIAVPGYKFNMTDIQAAIGIEQLRRLDENREKRAAVAESYSQFFKEYDFVKTPEVKSGVTHGWHLYPVVIDFNRMNIDRDTFIAALGAENIASNVHFIPVHMMSYYVKKYGYKPGDFPNAYRVYLNEVSLPIYPQMTRTDINDVLEALSKLFAFYKKNNSGVDSGLN
ncbi:MAG TPA: DegT/DnrJ/EryC1/StrS family aminotransferase [Spirochaetes bacterium]|nr:DegT/DnrJ/EryC1/StrS family aminotransferase [Spirochaetota bacterium]